MMYELWVLGVDDSCMLTVPLILVLRSLAVGSWQLGHVRDALTLNDNLGTR